MKNRNLQIGFYTLIAFTVISACNKDNELKPEVDNSALERYMAIKSTMGSFQQNNLSDNMEALGVSIMRNSAMLYKSASEDSSGVDSPPNGDTAYYQYQSCATITDTIDENGFNITINDYGTEGCDEWGSLIKGKITYMWKQNESDYYSKVIYENYSAYGLTMNGTSEYTYSFNMLSSMIIAPDSNTQFIWSGYSSCIEDIEMISADGEIFQYSGNYSTDWEQNSYTVHEGEYSYKNLTKGYEYTYRITKDLFYNYQCAETYVPVSGVEEIIQKENNIETHFITDYGDGTCDNLAVVTENGTQFIVDFGELWIGIGCGDAGCDSTVVVYNDEKINE